MGVTRIVRVENRDLDNLEIRFENYEKQGEPLNHGVLTGGTAHPADMAVPWCATQSDYNGGRWIFLWVRRIDGTIATFQLWQSKGGDGDFVRLRAIQNPTHQWPLFGYAPPMQGDSYVDGTRVLVFGSQGPYLVNADSQLTS